MLSPSYDLGGETKAFLGGYPVNSSNPTVITAAGTGDATAVTGQSIDRLDYDSAVLVIGWVAALADTKSLKLAVEYQESSDNSSWDTAVALQASAAVATSSGGTVEKGVTVFDLPLKARKRYIRFNFTPDLTASGTDTASLMAIAFLGGKRVTPIAN